MTRTGSRTIDVVLWVVAVATLGAVVVLSLGPPPSGLEAFPGADKLWHAIAYAGCTGSWLLAAVWRPGRGPGAFPRAGIPIVVGAAVLGGAIELVQRVFSRSADPLDWLADLAGIALASGGWLVARRFAH